MNTSQQQIHTCKSHIIKQFWNTKTLEYHMTPKPQYYNKTICSCTWSTTSSNGNFTLLNKTHIITKTAIQSCFY